MSDAPVLASSVLAIVAPARLLTTNAERRLHFHARADIVAGWRQAAWADALDQHVPKYEHCRIVVSVTQARGKLADAGAHVPVAKACVDGLVDAGCLLDDDPRYVRSIEYRAPTRGPDAVTLEIEGVVW